MTNEGTTQELSEREKERRELLAALEGRKVVGVDLDGQTFKDESQSTDRVTLTLDDGTAVEFSAFWCNDSTADLAWEVTMKERELAVGQVWKHKRNDRRRVEITALSYDRQRQGSEWENRVALVYVTRNTSRRRQPISETTLRKEYELAIVDARVARG